MNTINSPDMTTRLLQLAPATLLRLVVLLGHWVLRIGRIVVIVLAVHGIGLLGLERKIAGRRTH